MKRHIFISYSKKDKEFAGKLADDLMKAGHKVWLDRSLTVGEEWEETIERELREAQDVIVILSPNALASKWVQHEGSIAYGLEKPMFPVRISDLPWDELPLWAKKFQFHNFFGVDYQDALRTLISALTPPNPLQDLLDMQVATYKQTGELLSNALLEVIEEKRQTILLNEDARELLDKSRKSINREKRLSRLRWMVVASALGAALVIATLGITGQLNDFIYRPVDMDGYWVQIPAGDFLMGSNTEEDPLAGDNESPQHTVNLESYWIGRYEITSKQYRQCVKAGACDKPTNTVKFDDQQYEKHPVVFVNWFDAQAYCNWVDGRLPTEAEWEKAARGSEGRTFPWGEEIDINLANFDARLNDTAPVDGYPEGATPEGLLNMAGNVWEWTLSLNRSYPYESDDGRNDIESFEFRVLRGGAWNTDSASVRTATREVSNPDINSTKIGFRCARDANP